MDISLLPVWATALLVFGLRLIDVSLGTVRTISVVQGRIGVSVALGFVEVLIWVTAISQVIVNFERSPLLPLAYAAGFAAGNATGILLERKLAFGRVLLRLISTRADDIAHHLRARGEWATCIQSRGSKGHEDMLFGTCTRRALREVIAHARELDAELIYAVAPVVETGHPGHPLPRPGSAAAGWRAGLVRK